MQSVRLLIDPPASGAWNMAVDESLLESAAADGIATLRFYQWMPATLSLGYFQAAADREQHAASLDCPLVRRASGGGAILHDRELTYSIALPHHSAKRLSATVLYDLFHETLVAVLEELGVTAATHRPTLGTCETLGRQSTAEPFLCFQRRSCGDIICGEFKIVGSAQRRRRGAVLQHGSILLAQSPNAPELPGIKELTGHAIAPAKLIDAWTPRLAARLLARFSPASLQAGEAERAKAIASERFSTVAFTHQR